MLLATACAPLDPLPEHGGALPPDAAVVLLPDTARAADLGPGVRYRYLWSPRGPWAVHLVEADWSRCDLALRTLRARSREQGASGREAVTSMVARHQGNVLVAVNGDFFTPAGDALGAEVVGGRVTAVRERPALASGPGAPPWIGTVERLDDGLWAGRAVPRSGGQTDLHVVGGFPELLDEGARVGNLGVLARPGFAASRHPRTAVGFDPAARRLWLVVVDGRQPPYSTGMTLPELTALLEALGAEEALNLDGGGSSVMVVGGVARNRPSDGLGERPVVNALALVRDPSGCSRP